ESVRMRFFAPLKEVPQALAARLTQIDYEREMALVLAERAPPGEAEIFGSVRIVADPDDERAEFAITVRDDMAGRGLGSMLMQRILAYAAGRGIGEVFGHVLADNTIMLDLCRRLGFAIERSADDLGILRVSRRP